MLGRSLLHEPVLLPTASAVIAFLCLAGSAAAQGPPPPAPAPTGKDAPWEITDNSFLVEEAFNQDPKIVQNIVEFTRQSGEWLMTFTQEWPAPGMRHQLSYTLVADSVDARTGFGDVLLNYRLQVMEEGKGHPAIAPRVSVIVPSGRHLAGEGDAGLQVNLPASKHRSDFYFHGNAGFVWLPRGTKADLLSPILGGSAIYRLRPMFNLMLESELLFQAADAKGSARRVERTREVIVSPGLRGGWNVARDAQIILGAAMPVTRVNGESSVGVLGYFSYELPFKR